MSWLERMAEAVQNTLDTVRETSIAPRLGVALSEEECAGEDDSMEEPASADDRPLTTGERIEWHLARNGGRMWQRDVVAELGLSASTVSRWLCQLEEEGRVDRLALGREKVVALPGHQLDPTAADAAGRTAPQKA